MRITCETIQSIMCSDLGYDNVTTGKGKRGVKKEKNEYGYMNWVSGDENKNEHA